MEPAQQRLQRRHPAIGVALRLEGQPQLAECHGVAQLALQFHALPREGVHLRGEPLEIVPTHVLGPVHGHVRVHHQRLGIVAVVGKHADAQRHGHEQLAVADQERQAHRLDHLLGRAHRVAGIAEFAQHHGELIATQARQRVATADAILQSGGNLAQQVVAGGMPERVVDVLEAIQIHVDHRDLLAVATGAGQCLAEPILEQQAIGQAGEGVMLRLVRELVGQFAMLDGDGSQAAARGEQLPVFIVGLARHRADQADRPERDAPRRQDRLRPAGLARPSRVGGATFAGQQHAGIQAWALVFEHLGDPRQDGRQRFVLRHQFKDPTAIMLEQLAALAHGDVQAGTGHPGHLAIVVEQHQALVEDGALLLVRAADPRLVAERLLVLHGARDQVGYLAAILRVHPGQEILAGRMVGTGINAINSA